MTESTKDIHSRIIKNTLYLYVRMALTMFISLYTSRVVLQALGFVDYGIYALVGGIVALIAFMQSSLSGATTRFLNFEMGSKNYQNIKKVFDSAIFIHVLLCIGIILVGETVVLWFFNHHLNIPTERFYAAHVVFQLSLVAMLVTVLRTPYDAIIIANQRMSVFAVISIFEASLKLLVALLVKYLNFDKLILYSVLVLGSNILIAGVYGIYCFRSFEACRGKLQITKDYLKQISGFFGWDLYGNMSIAIRNQGTQIIQNMFFGTIINAATSIATTATGIVSSFTGNFTLAIKPQIFHYYAEGNIEKMEQLVFLSARFSYFLVMLISLPLILSTDFFLKLWLVNVPTHTAIFCKIIFFQLCITSPFISLGTVIHATGYIKQLSFINGSISLLSIVTSYIILCYVPNPNVIFVVNVVFALLYGFSSLSITKSLIKSFPVKKFLVSILAKNFILTFVVVFLFIISNEYFINDFYKIIHLIIIICIYVLVNILFNLNDYEKKFLSNKFFGRKDT